MRFGTANAATSALATGHIELGEYPDSPLVSPVMVARGAKDGARLFIQCLVHGPEVVGPVAVARFLNSLDLRHLRGTIAALLVANPLGFRGRNRLTPEDGLNLNRIFPGDPAGSVSEQLADRLMHISNAHGDVLLDLHSGGDLTITPFYAIHDKSDSDASRESARLVAATGSRYLWASDEGWMRGSSITNYARNFNKPALIVESGGGARVTDQDLANFDLALNGVCRALGMLEGEVPHGVDIRRGGNAVHIKCTRGGFWHPEVQPGDDATQGQILGRIVDVFGKVVEEIRCPFEKAWIGSIRRPFMAVLNGEQVLEVVESIAG